ncbi:HAD family hydrolase [Deminuibacter soli]|uniref:HAD family phosphatase n=1 Tax=Deminuibacter soli TaxID=2291815 RepID=A0A3E1ND35_9BACT|nr:HAD family phosphatase [Deminuibacter soli]RFM25919.1 HAD family phosphatase [Deminuibacter soli]
MPGRISRVLFDMDGVLINSNAAIETFWSEWASKEKLAITEADIRHKIHGRPTLETIDLLFAGSADETKQNIYSEARLFDITMRPLLLPGVKRFVTQLHAASVVTGVVTSAPAERITHMLQPHGIYHLFNAMVTSEDYTKGKPDPEPYTVMATRLAVKPSCCLVFEDADSGIRAALDAGMQVVAVNNAFEHERVIGHIPDFAGITMNGASILHNGNLLAQIDFSC